MYKTVLLLYILVHTAQAHHHDLEGFPWRMQGIIRSFFGGFFSTLFLIFGVLGFYYYCLRGTTVGRFWPLFPRKPILPITVPFARSSNFMDLDRHETIVLTAASPSSAFYSSAPPMRQNYAGQNATMEL